MVRQPLPRSSCLVFSFWRRLGLFLVQSCRRSAPLHRVKLPIEPLTRSPSSPSHLTKQFSPSSSSAAGIASRRTVRSPAQLPSTPRRPDPPQPPTPRWSRFQSQRAVSQTSLQVMGDGRGDILRCCQNCLFLRMRTQDYAVPSPPPYGTPNPRNSHETLVPSGYRRPPPGQSTLISPAARAGRAGRLKAWECVPPPCSPRAGWPDVEARRLQGNPMGA